MYLVIVVISMRFGQAGEKRYGKRFRVINWDGSSNHKKRSIFIGKGGSHLVLYFEILL